MDLVRFAAKLLLKRKNGSLIRSERRMQMKHIADIAVFERFFVVSIAEESKHHAVCANGRFDAVGDILGISERIHVFHALAAVLSMCLEIEIGTACNAPELSPAEGEQELDIGSAVGVVTKLLRRMLALPEAGLGNTEIQQEVIAVITPVVVPFKLCTRFAEELELHLLKLPCAEDEITGGYLVAEGLSDLSDAEGDLLPHRTLYIQEVDKDTLSRFGAQIDLVGSAFVYSLEGLKHHIELAYAREIGLAAFRANDVVLLDVLLHTLIGPAVGMDIGKTVRFRIILDELVRAESGLTCTAIHERVIEIADMAACDPNFGVHQNCAVHAHVVGAFLYKLAPPGVLNVVKKLYAERAVVPAVGETAVYFRTCKNVAPVFAQGYNFIHRKFFFHKLCFLKDDYTLR